MKRWYTVKTGMIVAQIIRTIVPNEKQENGVVYEYRSCGTTVDSEYDRCPYCGPSDIVRHEIR